MRSGITRQALRRHRLSLLGPAVTQLVAASVIAAMVDTRASLTDSLPPAVWARAGLSDVLDACTVFLGDAVYLSIVIVGVTMNLALGGQLRDIALLRAVGAAPAQVRRSAVLQSAATAVPAAPIIQQAAALLPFGPSRGRRPRADRGSAALQRQRTTVALAATASVGGRSRFKFGAGSCLPTPSTGSRLWR